jgi:uncharacterized membrane protein YeaQ/YmgE (transglycosylase-associated protein family)
MLFGISVYQIIVMLIVGGIAGWLAGLVVGGSRGLVRNVVVGLIGSLVAGFVLPLAGLNLSFGVPLLGTILHAAIGAVLVLVVARFIAR